MKARRMEHLGSRYVSTLLLAGAALSSTAAMADAGGGGLERARALTAEGLEALSRSEFDLARAKCEQASKLVDAPMVKLCVARATAGSGRLAAAAEVYADVAGRKLPKDAPDASVDAVRAAANELRDVQAKLARRDPLAATGSSADQRDLLAAGFAALDAQQPGPAEEAFTTTLASSASPAALWGRSQARIMAGTTMTALEDVRSFLAGAGSDARFAEAVAKAKELRVKLEGLLVGTVKLEVESTPGLQVSIDDAAPRPLTGSEQVKLAPGNHTIRGAAPGHSPFSASFKLDGGGSATVQVKLAPLPPLRTAGWVMLGVGAAAFGVSGFFANQATATHATLIDGCNAKLQCGKPQWDEMDHYNQARTLTFITAGVGAAALVTSGILHLKMPSDAMPAVTVGLNGASLQGSF